MTIVFSPAGKERISFDSIQSKLEQTLQQKKAQIALAIEATNVALETRDEANKKIAYYNEELLRNQQDFDAKWRELDNEMESEEKRRRQVHTATWLSSRAGPDVERAVLAGEEADGRGGEEGKTHRRRRSTEGSARLRFLSQCPGTNSRLCFFQAQLQELTAKYEAQQAEEARFEEAYLKLQVAAACLALALR